MACGTALLIVAVVGMVVSRNRQQVAPPPDVPVEASPAEVRVKAVVLKPEPMELGAVVLASGAVAIVCGMDELTAARYEARNVALRSIARRRDLSADDIAALMEYVASTNYVLRVDREAALKNDVLNLLRNQASPPEGLAEMLMEMLDGNNMDNGKNNFNSSAHNRARVQELAHGCARGDQGCSRSCSSCFPSSYPPVIIDYCIQHLGAMANSVADDAMQARIRETFVAAAKNTNEPYAGTALYSLAELPQKSKDEGDELRRLTVGLCSASANQIARIAAIQLAGERGYREVLPTLRNVLAGGRRDAVLDMAVVGSIGLLGDAKDVQLLESFRSRGGRRLKTAIDAAVQRIKERGSQ